MKIKGRLVKKILFTIFFLLGILLISNISQASSGSLKLKNLNYDINLNSDGSMDIVETWEIKIEDTNTLFKTFELDQDYGGFSNAEIYEIEKNGTKTKFNRIDKEMYHVTKGSYYALINSKGKYEIAWGVSVKNKTKTYQMKYTVNDCIKNFSDCSEIYWKLISTDSSIPADKVTGTIKLPQKVSQLNDLRAWAHGPLNGNISIDRKDTVSFEVSKLNANTLLEFRIVSLDKTIFYGATNVNEEKLEYILAEEEELANEANKQRIKAQKKLERQQQLKNIISIMANIIIIAMCIFFIWKMIKYIITISKTKKIVPTQQFDYFRDIPNESFSPAQVAFLHYFEKNKFNSNLSKIVSATILNLALKKYVAFSTDNRKGKEDIRITLLTRIPNENSMGILTADEQVVYNLLEKVANTENSFTMKELNKYAKSHSSTFMSTLNQIQGKAQNELQQDGCYDKDRISFANKWNGKAVCYVIFAMLLFVNGMVISFELEIFTPMIAILALIWIIDGILCLRIYKKNNTLPQKGIDELEKWNGLKRYMNDFSLLNEKEVPDLALWEKYLVFATAFGIADRVINQLKVRYPELNQMNSNGYNYTYMHLMYHNSLNTAFVSSLNKSVSKAYHTSASEIARSSASSGGGHGGGFSGGGHSHGGGHGGGSMGGR